MIEFVHPWIIAGLLCVPIIIWWHKYKGKSLEGSMRISSSKLFSNHFRKRGNKRSKTVFVLKIITISLIIVGIAQPRRIDKLQMTTVDVVDIIMVLDISSSMLAEDFQPNRLEAVKTAAQQFIENRAGDRIGLLVFAGETFIQCPLTTDKDVLVSLLNDVRVAEKEYDGTAIGMAIANATNR